MSFSSSDAQPSQESYANAESYEARQPRQQFDLTPEELRVIRECSREGIFTRALPLGVLFGIGGLVGAKAGPLMNAKFGVKPAVIGFGILGYFVGRMTYSKVCFQRALQVPDGNLRKMFPHLVKDNEFLEPSQNFYSSSEKSQDTYARRNSSTDIDLPTMTNLDTTPSEYYANDYKDDSRDKVESYTSYDDLRKQNRQEYNNKFFGPESQRSPSRQQYQNNPNTRRPPQDPQNFEGSGGQKTKYGDVFE